MEVIYDLWTKMFMGTAQTGQNRNNMIIEYSDISVEDLGTQWKYHSNTVSYWLNLHINMVWFSYDMVDCL